MTRLSKTVVVIGGGVSGIAAAHYLLEAGYHVDVFEASDQLGGRISIDALGDREVCFGGKNIGWQYDEFRAFLQTYTTPEYEYFGINSARLVRGNIKAFNSKNKIKSFLNLLSAASLRDLFRLKKAMIAVKVDRQNGDTCGPYFKNITTKDNATIEAYFSPKFAATIIRSLTVRMNGSEPSQVSLENLGTHLHMLRDEYDQLNSPLSEVMSAFQKRENLKVHLNSWVETLSYDQEGFHIQTASTQTRYEYVIVALPADAAEKLLRVNWPKLASFFREVRYMPVGVIVAEYKNPVFTPDIRALTFGVDSPLSNIGAYGMNDLNLVRYTFSGEAAHETLDETLNERDLVIMAEAIANPYFNIVGNPRRHFKVKYWPSGLCGYTRSETQFQSNLMREIKRHPGLFLTGDYLKGTSIENCFRAAKASVDSLIKSNST